MSEKIYDNFIIGQDISPEVCLNEGYLSAWYHPEEKAVLYILTIPIGEGEFKYDWGYFERESVIEDFLDMEDKEKILEFAGVQEEDFIKQSTVDIIATCNSYSGCFIDFVNYSVTDNFEDILGGVIPKDSAKTFKEMTEEEKKPYLKELGII